MFKQLTLGLSALLLAAGIGGKASASVFYDWQPDSSSGGVGFIEFSTGTPANFFNLDPVGFMFDFQEGTVPVITFSDVETLESFDATDGVLTAGLLIETDEFEAEENVVVDFGADLVSGFANCVGLAPTTCNPSSNNVFGDIFFNGSWVLRSDLPEPATLALFGVGLAGLGVAARRQRQR